jgi:hypothetical protein
MRSSVRVIQAQQRWSDEDPVEKESRATNGPEGILANTSERVPLWQLDIVEVTGHNLETRGREEVNRLLESGWLLLHIYTLKYREDEIWRERPMAILGRPRRPVGKIGGAHEASSADHVSEHSAVGSH